MYAYIHKSNENDYTLVEKDLRLSRRVIKYVKYILEKQYSLLYGKGSHNHLFTAAKYSHYSNSIWKTFIFVGPFYIP